MDQITINSIKLEQAEFLNKLMIDAELSKNDIKIGLCLLHDILSKIKERERETKD
jgi:energy-converting hydrogenase A subunit M